MSSDNELTQNVDSEVTVTPAKHDSTKQCKRQLPSTDESTGLSPEFKKQVRSKVSMPSKEASVLEWNQAIFMKMEEMDAHYEHMCQNYDEIKEAFAFNNKELEDCKKELAEMKIEMNDLKTQVNILECDKVELQVQCRLLSESHLKAETHRREQNLVFEGVQETYGEDTQMLHNKIVRVLNHMMIFAGNGATVPIARVHRVGPFVKGKNWPIVCHFARYYDMQLLLKNRTQLPDGVFVHEDYPPEIEDRRHVLRPIFNKARKSSEYKGKCRLMQDKLILDGKAFTVNNLKDLPKSLHPRTAAEKCNQEALVFFTQGSPFSNFYLAPFVIDYTRYVNNEQYIQAKKAELFNDDDSHSKIMQTSNPYAIKTIGSRVRNFIKQKWEQHARKIAMDACTAKFAQNPDLLEILLSTDNKDIGEASTDPFRGIGKSLNDDNVLDQSLWTGDNVLGHVLMTVRKNLK